MTQNATVRRVLPRHRVELAIQRESACGHDCSSCGGCSMGEKREVVVLADDPCGAKPGDVVTVESSTGAMMKIAAIVYGLPVVLFFALYLLLSAVNAGETVSTAGAVIGFAAGILVAILCNRREKRKGTVRFTVTAIKG